MRLWYVVATVFLIVSWLSLGTIQSGNYSPREWHIVHWVFVHHGYDCAVCVDDMTFVRGDGPNAGETCRIILPDSLSLDKEDTLCF